MQVGFLAELARRCKEENIHVALDTSGVLPWEAYEQVLPFVDLVLLDLKILDAQRHRVATGMDNANVLENARRLAAMDKPMWIRTPVIPGYTSDAENIEAIGRFIRIYLPNVERWDLLAYTNLGKPKYHRLDLHYALDSVPLMARSEMEAVWDVASRHVPVAQWSGATRD